MIDPDAPVRPEPIHGPVKGYVRDNKDPQGRGRLRVYCPQVGGPIDDEKHWLPWAEPKLPWLGGINTLDFGSPLTIQQQGGKDIAGVWIEFENGHPDFPIWTGTFTVAPTPKDPEAQQDLTKAAGALGGSILDAPPPGCNFGDIDPPQPRPNDRETRILVKKGRDIMIGSVKGGYIILGPSGVNIVGPQVTINGALINSSAADGLVK